MTKTKPNIIPLTFLPPELDALKKGVRVFLFKTEHRGRKLPDIKPGDVIENRMGKRRLPVTQVGRPLKVRDVSPALRARVTPPGLDFDDYAASMELDDHNTVRAITVRVRGEA